MARTAVLSHGELTVTLDQYGQVADVYLPYVGHELHTDDTVHRVGLWVDERIVWLDDPGWQRTVRFPYEALVAQTRLTHAELGLVLECDDFVAADVPAFIRNIHIVNQRSEARTIRCFFHQAFRLGDHRRPADTAQYIPAEQAVLHYRGRRAFVVSGFLDGDPQQPSQWSVGRFGEGLAGTWRDAEDGQLSGCRVEFGQTDSVLGFEIVLPGHCSRRVHYWLAAGSSTRQARAVSRQLRQRGIHQSFTATIQYWQRWLRPSQAVLKRLPRRHQHLFVRSLLTLRSHVDMRGPVMSCLDGQAQRADGERQAYCQSGHAAYLMWPLLRLGHHDELRRFFLSCRHAMLQTGALPAAFRADGALAGSRLAYDDAAELPHDITAVALVVFLFGQAYRARPAATLLDDFYAAMIVPMAKLLCAAVQPATGLVPSDFTPWRTAPVADRYTAAAVFAGLVAAADLADATHDADQAVAWRTRADDIQAAVERHLVDNDQLVATTDGTPLDIPGFYASFMFGLLESTDERLGRACQNLEQRLQTTQGAFRLRANGPVDTVATLWMAQYYYEVGRTAEAQRCLRAVLAVAASDMLPATDEAGAPSPWAWAQAELVQVLLDSVVTD